MIDEVDLIAFSNTVINRCELNIDAIIDGDPIVFKEKFVGPRGGLMAELLRLRLDTLSEVITHGFGPQDSNSFYRLTPVSALTKTGSVTIMWTGKKGRDQLVHMAKFVVTACMYDILRAESWIQQVSSGKVSERALPFKPKPAMIRFVQNMRINPKILRPAKTVAE